MIRSILDTDLYKFTTSYAYFKLYPEAIGTFTFNDRAKTEFDEDFLEDLKAELKALERIALSEDEFQYMIKNCKYIPQNYFEWLNGFRFDASKINVWLDEEHHLQINVTDFMYKVTLYEIPILATVSELFHLRNSYDAEAMIARLEQKEQIARDNNIIFSDFGTRRRFSYDVQRMVVKHLKNNPCGCVGTSNCHLAMELDMKMIGTYPHELPMFIAAVNGGPRNANYLTMEDWVKVYDGYLGTALTDSFGSEVFFNNFSKKHACLFDGVRHDSGDPIAFIEMAIKRYKELGIDPMTKSIVFSDSLNFEKCVEIKRACEGKIKCMFGIGTNLTCDTGHASCNIVMKLSSCQINSRKPKELCVKLSDVEGKEMGDPQEVAVYRYLLRNQGNKN